MNGSVWWPTGCGAAEVAHAQYSGELRILRGPSGSILCKGGKGGGFQSSMALGSPAASWAFRLLERLTICVSRLKCAS